jgi:hypothetical protein
MSKEQTGIGHVSEPHWGAAQDSVITETSVPSLEIVNKENAINTSVAANMKRKFTLNQENENILKFARNTLAKNHPPRSFREVHLPEEQYQVVQNGNVRTTLI